MRQSAYGTVPGHGRGPEKQAGMLRKLLCSHAVTPLSLIVTVSGHGNKF